ncbi:hypothetical protein B0H14DRAFT_3508467 [Mycena olivaceomarginata]|nr:hypothetical protein B0H14DRAFT_3508467 [Mycena olivaceomarginata]
MEKITQFVDLCTATTATIAPPAAILGLAYFFVKWFSDEVLQNTYVSPPLFPQQLLEELLNFALLSTSGKMTWTELKEAFEAYYRSPSQPNVHSRVHGPTEAQVRAELKREEERDAASGKVPLHGTSATAFLTGGLQIEDAQRRIIAELGGLTIR